MQYARITLVPALLAASLAGQGTETVKITTGSSSDKALRYTIHAEFETNTSREVLINGGDEFRSGTTGPEQGVLFLR